MGKSIFADQVGNFFVAHLGTLAAIASGGANGRIGGVGFVAPANLKLLSAWRHNLSANEVTAGTAVSSASYRRHLLYNGGSAGTSTATANILATQNATASAALGNARAFAMNTVATVSAGDVIYYSQLTVGAASADGTDAAASALQIAYQLL